MMSEFPNGGMYIMPNKSNSLIIEGIYFPRIGLFKNAIIRFSILLEKTFPHQKTPVLKLDQSVLHPLVSEDTGVFDCTSAFPEWSENDHLYELLKFFKYSMENIEYSCGLPSPVNHTAVQMFTQDREKYLEKCKETVTQTMNDVFNAGEKDEHDHFFRFDKTLIDENLQEQIVESMKNFNEVSLNDFSFSFERRG